MALLSGQPQAQSQPTVRHRPRLARRSDGTRNPLVALAMALPVGALLAVLFGGWAEFVAQASPVLKMIGR